MLCCLLAYDAAGNVVATLDHLVARDADGNVTGLIDFEAHETGGKLRDIWEVSNAVGSATWPEWLGSQAHSFKIAFGPDKRIVALVHRISGHRRQRSDIEAAVATQPVLNGERDIRHLVGGPDRPLILDEQGRTLGRSPQSAGTPAHLPIVGARRQ